MAPLDDLYGKGVTNKISDSLQISGFRLNLNQMALSSGSVSLQGQWFKGDDLACKVEIICHRDHAYFPRLNVLNEQYLGSGFATACAIAITEHLAPDVGYMLATPDTEESKKMLKRIGFEDQEDEFVMKADMTKGGKMKKYVTKKLSK